MTWLVKVFQNCKWRLVNGGLRPWKQKRIEICLLNFGQVKSWFGRASRFFWYLPERASGFLKTCPTLRYIAAERRTKSLSLSLHCFEKTDLPAFRLHHVTVQSCYGSLTSARLSTLARSVEMCSPSPTLHRCMARGAESPGGPSDWLHPGNAPDLYLLQSCTPPPRTRGNSTEHIC